MPVTKTAKRALRSSAKKAARNKARLANLEAAIRLGQKGPKKTKTKAQALLDRAVKNNILHKNKAARIKSSLFTRSKTGSSKK